MSCGKNGKMPAAPTDTSSTPDTAKARCFSSNSRFHSANTGGSLDENMSSRYGANGFEDFGRPCLASHSGERFAAAARRTEISGNGFRRPKNSVRKVGSLSITLSRIREFKAICSERGSEHSARCWAMPRLTPDRATVQRIRHEPERISYVVSSGPEPTGD